MEENTGFIMYKVFSTSVIFMIRRQREYLLP